MAGKKKINIADLIFKIGDDGTLKIMEGQTKKTGKAVDNLGKSEATLNRNFKGASRQSSNQTKNFSKMAQGITGGLVPAYATLAANIFAIGAAFRFLQDAANYRILIQGQQEYANVTGESLSLITDRLRTATGAQLSFAEAAQSAAIGRAAGLSSDQLSRLGNVAKNASVALGRDLTDSFNRLVRGAVKAEPELLDELGIILRLETATKKYAQEIGKSAQALNIFEKSQAVVNEVLTQGEEKFGEFNTELNAFNKLAVSFDDLINKIKIGLTGVAEFLAKTLSKNVVALAGSFALLGSGILKAITPEVPNIDIAGQAATGKKSLQGMLNADGKAKFGNLDDPKKLDMFDRHMSSQKTKFSDMERHKRLESKKTVAIIKAHNVQMEAQSGGMFKKMGAKWKAELLIMQAEYGKFVGTIKAMGMALSRFVSALGWAGLIITVIGILAQLASKFKQTDEAAEKFKEKQLQVADAFEKTANEVKRIADNLVMTDTVLTNLIKKAKLFANPDFSGAVESMGKGVTKNRGPDGFLSQTMVGLVINKKSMRLDKNQHSIVSAMIQTIDQIKSKVDGKTREKIQKQRNTLFDALYDRDITKDEFANLIKTMTSLETSGLPGMDSILELANAPIILKNTGEAFTKSLRGLRPNSTNLTNMTNSIRDMGDVLTKTGEVLENLDFSRLLTGEESQLLDSVTQDTVASMLGRDVYAKITEPYTDAVMKDGKEVGRVLRDGLTTVEKGKLMSELSVGLREKEKQLMEAEDRLMNKRMEIQTKLMQGSMGMPKLIVDEAKKKAKVLDIEEQIFAIEEVRRQRASSNTTIDKAADDNEITKIANLNARLDVAKRLTNEMLVLKDGVVNAFSSSMQNAIQGLITGTMKLKDAFKSMLKSVLQMMAQLLAKMAALRILNSMGFAIPMADGGVIPMAKGGITGYRNGGIATEPTYLVGEGKHNEAVVPLPDGRSIPVNMKGGGNNNIVVNVDANGGSSSTGMSGEQGKVLGKVIAATVMETIQREKRPGGVLG
jgi:hypothetical protein